MKHFTNWKHSKIGNCFFKSSRLFKKYAFFFFFLTFGVRSFENFLLSFTAKNRNSLALKVSYILFFLRGGSFTVNTLKIARVGNASMLNPWHSCEVGRLLSSQVLKTNIYRKSITFTKPNAFPEAGIWLTVTPVYQLQSSACCQQPPRRAETLLLLQA